MNLEMFVGYLAAFCTTAAYVPQAIKVYKTKKTKDISLGMFLLMTVGVSSWLIYGFIIASPPVISANLITLLLILYILVVKIITDYIKK